MASVVGGTCCVCLEKLHLSPSADHCTSLSCGHALHKKCLDRVLCTTPCCPLCRVRINTDRLLPVEDVPGGAYDRGLARSFVPRSGQPALFPAPFPEWSPVPFFRDADDPLPSHATHAAGPDADPRSSLLTHLTPSMPSIASGDGAGAYYVFCLDVSGAALCAACC